MKGSLQERPKGSGTWQLRVYTGQRTPGGHPIQTSKTFHGPKRTAQSELARFVTQVSQQRASDKGVGHTVGSLLERWMQHIEPKRSLHTVKGYRSKIDFRIRPTLGTVPLDRLGPEQIDRALTGWTAEGLSAATVRQLYAILAAALNQAYKWDWINRNPATRVDPPAVRRKPSRAITAGEIRALLEAVGDDTVLASAVALAATTGCRRGELCALRWSHVVEHNLVVAQSLTVLGGKATVGGTKTHQARRIALDPLSAEVIRLRMVEQRRLSAVAELPLDADPWLLSRHPRGDRPCLPDGLTHAFNRAAKQQGLPYHFHDLRHFAATELMAAGVDARTVAGRLGHSTPALTLSTYAHVVEARDEMAAELLGRRVLGPGPVT